MSNKIIYPILIIIFSILIVYAILTKRKNDKLNNNIEKFLNYDNPDNPDKKSNDLSKSNLAKNNINNSIMTNIFANGYWTTPTTKVNVGKVENVMQMKATSLMKDNISSGNYGSINVLNNNYTITFISNENIIGKTTSNNFIYIKIYNTFSKESKDVPQINGTITSMIKMYNDNVLMNEFFSYKIPDISNIEFVKNLIKKQDVYVKKPAEVYDLKAYTAIINNYQYADNFLYMKYASSNEDILNKIKVNYSNKLIFSIKRVYKTITGSNITTTMSPNITLKGYDDNKNIASYIVMKSFLNDLNKMGLTSTFIPVSTILYFYRLKNIDTKYSYGDNKLYNTPNSTFNLKNNAENMYLSTIQYNNLNSITETNNSIYELTLVGLITYAIREYKQK